ncbi:uncharacterized protein A4U43_C01F14400 [Asparagus officinalis]|uniref:Uncharacterized protein n=1 Tax=Asparagus officinalis TaxID=4686 RepID=A0A5P1FRT4_ASPOF|nr:uncharacterized protein A4U43_C01F14400 [Asparagus officinalis]
MVPAAPLARTWGGPLARLKKCLRHDLAPKEAERAHDNVAEITARLARSSSVQFRPRVGDGDASVLTQEASIAMPPDIVIIDDRFPAREEWVKINMAVAEEAEDPIEGEVALDTSVKSAHWQGKKSSLLKECFLLLKVLDARTPTALMISIWGDGVN